MKTEAVGYCRVSSLGQKSGTGLDRQEVAIRDYAKTNNYRISKVYLEAFTGTESDRPVFESMLADILDNGCRTIIVECLDRLARDLAIQLQLIALLASKKVTLLNAMTGQDVTNPTDAMTKAMIQIQGTFAELDKNLLIRKLRRGRDAKREKAGSCEGRKPFGYYDDEVETLDRIRALHRKPQGKPRRGYAEIARILNTEKLPTRSGKPWLGSTVSHIVKRLNWHS